MNESLRLAGVALASRANGPGLRDVYWTAGCSLRCPGCQNPHLWEAGAGRWVPVREIAAFMAGRRDKVEGITISGGEPTEQPRALLALVTEARSLSLTVVLFTGRTWEECRSDRHLWLVVEKCDVVVAGPFLQELRVRKRPLVASSNQVVAFPTGRYAVLDLRDIPNSELLMGSQIVATGFPD